MAGLTRTLFVQLAGIVGSPVGGSLSGSLRQRFISGRIANCRRWSARRPCPLLVSWGQSLSCIFAHFSHLAFSDFFRGLYDADLFTSVRNIVRAGHARGRSQMHGVFVGSLRGRGAAQISIRIRERRRASFKLCESPSPQSHYWSRIAVVDHTVLLTVQTDVERAEPASLQGF